MAQQDIIIGDADAKQGDTLFSAFTKSQANFTDLYNKFANNVIIINSVEDFPTQDVSTITLDANTSFFIGTPISTDKTFTVLGGADISSIGPFSLSLIYTGTGTMFNSSGASWQMKDLGYSCTNGTIFGCSGLGAIFNKINSLCVSTTNIGSFTDISVGITNAGILGISNQGFVLIGSPNTFSIIRMLQVSTNAGHVAVDFGTSTFDNIEIDNFEPEGPPGSVALKGAINSANVNANRIATVTNSTLNGGSMTPLSGISNEDFRWEFLGNSQPSDTITDALVSLTNNAAETVISTINTPVKVLGTWVCERQSIFSCDTTGRITYIGERDVTLPIDITITTIAASGTNKDTHTYLALNGSVITRSGVKNRVGSTDPKNTVVLWQVTLSTNDYLEVFIENNTDTINLIGEDAALRAR